MIQKSHASNSTEGNRLELSEKAWQKACHARSVVEHWLDCEVKSRSLAEKCAAEIGVSASTFYRLVRRYVKENNTSCFLPSYKEAVPREINLRLDDKQEALISKTIDRYYLNKRRPTLASAYQQLQVDCKLEGIPLPSKSTFRNRVRSLPPRTTVGKRFSIKHANEKYKLEEGHFPYAEYPLQCIQIDHTPTDRHLVDPDHRCVIGRAFLTTAIDCYSRACLGYYVSYAHPSTLSVAMCLAHSVLRKDRWLLERRISAPWQMHGLPGMIHTDNAQEFTSKLFKRDCQEYGISVQFRPLGRPNFGGTVESWIRNLNRQNHGEPGSTLGVLNKNSDYDPEKDACLTLSELDRRWGLFITGVYHNQVHSEIGMPPMAKFEQGIKMLREKYGKTIREPEDPDRFLLDFLPQISRTVQKYGVRFNHIEYEGQILNYLLNKHEKEKFIIRYDPRDISRLFIYVPNEQRYYPLYYKDKSLPPMSQYEYNCLHREAVRAGKALVNEEQIHQSLLEMRRDTEKALKETKAHKRKRRQNALSTSKNPSSVPSRTKAVQRESDKDTASKKSVIRANQDKTVQSDPPSRVYEFDPDIIESGIDLE